MADRQEAARFERQSEKGEPTKPLRYTESLNGKIHFFQTPTLALEEGVPNTIVIALLGYMQLHCFVWLSYDDFANGYLPPGDDKERVDRGCGAGLTAVKKWLKWMEDRGWIKRHDEKRGKDKARIHYRYTVLIGTPAYVPKSGPMRK